MTKPKLNLATQELASIVEHIPAVVLRLSHKGNNWHTWFISKNISIYGYEVEDFLSQKVTWLDLVHPDDRVLVMNTINEYETLNTNSYKLHYRLVTKDGEVVPASEYTTVIRDTDGKIIYDDTVLVSSKQDELGQRIIDDHYRQQIVLNDILLSLHDSDLSHAIQIILDRAGKYLDCSRVLLFKDSPDHKACTVVYEWCNKDITPVLHLDYSIVYETGMPEIYIALRTSGNLIINASEIPDSCIEEFEAEGCLASAIFAVYLNGEHWGFVCFDDCMIRRRWDDDTARFLKNISNLISTALARKKAGEELVLNRKIYESILDTVDSYIFATDPETNELVFANHAFKLSYGDNCIGKNADNFLPISSFGQSQLETKAKGKTEEYAEIFCKNSGEWLALSMESMTWMTEKQVYLYNCYNITQKKLFSDTLEKEIKERTGELELMTEMAEIAKLKAEDVATTKAQFLANMSHEIRTPMNAIFGLSELLANIDINPAHQKHIRNIRHSSRLLLAIINDILDISALNSGNLSLVNVDYNLQQTIDYITSLTYEMTSAKDIEFKVIANSPLSVCLWGDDIRLRQILINLLSNAVKYTTKGYVELNVTLTDKHIIFAITDTGMGIKEEALEFIFDSFAKLDMHINRNIQGTGLGLPICKNLTELMDGKLEISSEYGKGSIFTVTIPKVLGDETKLEQENTLRICLQAPDAKVLVVDDIDLNLYVAAALLQTYGIEPMLAESGEVALELIQKNSFDLIFMDHMMPGMDGIATAQAIRAMNPNLKKTPIVMLTANVTLKAKNMFEEAGLDDLLPKPLESHKLTAILKKWLPPEKVIEE